MVIVWVFDMNFHELTMNFQKLFFYVFFLDKSS